MLTFPVLLLLRKYGENQHEVKLTKKNNNSTEKRHFFVNVTKIQKKTACLFTTSPSNRSNTVLTHSCAYNGEHARESDMLFGYTCRVLQSVCYKVKRVFMIKIQNNPSHIFFAIRPVILVGYGIQSTKSVNIIGYVGRQYLAKKK